MLTEHYSLILNIVLFFTKRQQLKWMSMRGASKMWFCSLVPGMTSISSDDGSKTTCHWLTNISDGFLREEYSVIPPTRLSLYNSCGFWGWGLRLRTRLPSLSHKCSIGFKSAGQSRTSIAFVWKEFCVNLAVCARALSCWKNNPFRCLCCCINGTTTGRI